MECTAVVKRLLDSLGTGDDDNAGVAFDADDDDLLLFFLWKPSSCALSAIFIACGRRKCNLMRNFRGKLYVRKQAFNKHAEHRSLPLCSEEITQLPSPRVHATGFKLDDDDSHFLSIREINLRHGSQLYALNLRLICDAGVFVFLHTSQPFPLAPLLPALLPQLPEVLFVPPNEIDVLNIDGPSKLTFDVDFDVDDVAKENGPDGTKSIPLSELILSRGWRRMNGCR